MSTAVKNSYKIILTRVGLLLGLLILVLLIAFLFEDYYRQLVRFSFKVFNGDNIQFIGKNFHLFASDTFVVSLGLFIWFTCLILKLSARRGRIKRALLIGIIFFATTILVTALDSYRLVIECTACKDGIRRLTFNQLTYDKYFIISLATASAYLLTVYLLERKRNSKANEAG